MKLLHISDTHNQHESLLNLPEADVLIHSGDLTFAGSKDELDAFFDWFVKLPYKHKIFIAGNHDDCLLDYEIDKLPKNIFYLNNSSINIDDGTVKNTQSGMINRSNSSQKEHEYIEADLSLENANPPIPDDEEGEKEKKIISKIISLNILLYSHSIIMINKQ